MASGIKRDIGMGLYIKEDTMVDIFNQYHRMDKDRDEVPKNSKRFK